MTVPPDPNDQVGIIDGNSSGIVVDAINAPMTQGRDPRGRLLGNGLEHPDLSYAVPSTATINTNQNRNGSIMMGVTKNTSFTGVVSTSAFQPG